MNQTAQPAAKLSKERSFLLAIFIVIVTYIFLAAPDRSESCRQSFAANSDYTAQEIRDICD